LDVRVKNAIDSGIRYSLEFSGWEAAIAAGAGLDEMIKWANGEYPRAFMAKVIMWNELHRAVEMHIGDASQK
jgi:hypothetical protein